MANRARFVANLIVVLAIVSFMVGSSAFVVQFVKAQNMTANTTDSSGNMSGADFVCGPNDSRCPAGSSCLAVARAQGKC